MASINDIEITLLVTPEKVVESWNNIGEMCEAHGLSKHTVYKQLQETNPLKYKGFVITTMPINTKISKESPLALKISFDTTALQGKIQEMCVLLEGVSDE